MPADRRGWPGASPGRLARQVLAENVILATLAGLVALVLANPAAAWLGSYFERPSVWGFNFPRVTSMDWQVVVFVVAVEQVAVGGMEQDSLWDSSWDV